MVTPTTIWVFEGNTGQQVWTTSWKVIWPVKVENWVKVQTILSSLRGNSLATASEARKYLIELYPELEEILWEDLWEDDQVKADAIILSFFEEFSWVEWVLTDKKDAVRKIIREWESPDSIKQYERQNWDWSFTAWTSSIQVRFLRVFSVKLYSLVW